jgi:CheY-like chemotaxis protein
VEISIMLRLSYSVVSRSVLPLTFACGLAICGPLKAQDTLTPAPAPAEATPADRQLRNDVDAYFHYAWIARYDLAAQFAQKITDETTDPAALIPILEDTAKLHDANMGYLSQLLLFDNQADLKDATDKLLLKVQAGNVSRAQDPDLIAQTVRDMSASERAYEDHLPYLRRSGELAVPVMLQFLKLQDDQHLPYRGTVRRALADLGRPAVNPLLAAIYMKDDNDTLLTVIDTLGSLGYSEAAPYLGLLAADASMPDPVRNAARTSLARLAITPDQYADPARMFYALAERFYYGNADIAQVIDNPGATAQTPVETCNYWVWDADKGLMRTEVPAAIFNDLQTLRATEQALKIQPDMPEAVALWLDADNKREADLPDGSTDPVRGSDLPAHYYNVSSGARHLKEALARALTDRNSAVALKLTHSLGQIVGRVSLDGRIGDPLTEALRFPDKRVRFEAALALATALPAKPFANQELVVPLLVQAIGEGGGGNVLVVGDNLDDANSLADTLRKLGYVTAVAGSPGEAVTAAATLPSVDTVVIGRGVSDEDIARVITLAGQTPPLADAVELALKETDTGAAAALAMNNPLFSVTTETDGDGLKTAIEAAREKAGMGAISQSDADAYALAAAAALDKLVISQNDVLSVSVGETGLLAALEGSKTDLISAVGGVVANLPSKTAQQGLAARALDDQAPAAVRLALFKSLADSAKAFGNLLDDAQVSLLQKESVELKDTDLRSAAAEARGALNLSTDQARDLILGVGAGSGD